MTMTSTRSESDGLEVFGRDADRDAQERIQHEDRQDDEAGQVGDRQPEILDAHDAVGRGRRDQRQDQPAHGVVDDAGRQDDQADVALGQVQVDQDLGDDGHRRDRHRGRQEHAEQHPAVRIHQVLGGHEVAEPEAEPERQDHPHHRRDQRRAPQVAQQAQVGLETGQQQQHAHADGAERVEQVKLLPGRAGRWSRTRPGNSVRAATAPARSPRSARRPRREARNAWRSRPRSGRPPPAAPAAPAARTRHGRTGRGWGYARRPDRSTWEIASDPAPAGAHRVGEAGLCLAESIAGGLEPSQGSEV